MTVLPAVEFGDKDPQGHDPADDASKNQPPLPEVMPDLDSLDAAAIEAFARRLGWKSPDYWASKQPESRRPSEMLSARAYVEKTMAEAPLLRNRLRMQDQQISGLTTKLDETGRKLDDTAKVIRSLHDSHKTVRDRAYKAAREDLQAEMDAAARTGDPQTYDDRKARITRLDADQAAATAAEVAPSTNGQAAPPAGEAPAKIPEVDDWAARHSWFRRNVALNQEAIAHEATIDRRIPLAERLEMTSDWIEENFGAVPAYKQFFPHLQRQAAPQPDPARVQPTAPPRNPRRTGAAAVAAPSGGAPSRAPAGLTYDALTAEEKAACDQLVTTVKGFTVDDYLKEYKR